MQMGFVPLCGINRKLPQNLLHTLTHIYHRSARPHPLRMANIETPQLKFSKKMFGYYGSRDISDVGQLLAKDFKFLSFPKVPEIPDQTKDSHLKTWGGILGSFAKLEPIVHEIIDAPGKNVIHATFRYTTVDGAKFDCDTVLIVTFVEEDGVLKALECKDFSDPQKRCAIYAEFAKVSAKGELVA